MADNGKDHRPIFIVGCERSGTTMLRLILHSHKNIAIPPQTKYIKKVYKRRLLFGNLVKENNRTKLREWFYNNHNKNTKLSDLNIDRSIIQTKLNAAGNSLGSFLACILQSYADEQKKPRWGDKRPYFIKYLQPLFSLYPDAQVIHIIRDCRDSVASLKSMPWWKNNSIYAMLNWQEAIQKGKLAQAKYSSNKYMEIRYEDIINDPEKHVKLIFKFLNEHYSSDLLNFSKIADSVVPDYKMEWHSGVKQRINSKRIGRWKNDLEPWEITLINRTMKKELKHHDYDLIDKVEKLPLSKLIKYVVTKTQYKLSQMITAAIDKIMSFLYWGELDYRK